jgi:hypothetical protein
VEIPEPKEKMSLKRLLILDLSHNLLPDLPPWSIQGNKWNFQSPTQSQQISVLMFWGTDCMN